MGVSNVDILKADAVISGRQILTDDGAITIKDGIVLLDKAGVIAATLAAPTAGAVEDGGDDFKKLQIVAKTAQAHTVTQTTPGFNNAGAGSDVATFAAAIGNHLNLYAYNGAWYVEDNLGVTLA